MIMASVLVGVGIVVVAGAVMTTRFVNTPPFTGDDGNILPGSIAEFTRVTLGGNSQAVLIRGKNMHNPVMLYLHMGPGLSETGMMRNHHAWLEEYFTMVYLDQRGGGKSYSMFNNPKDFTTDQLVEDVHELTLYLKKTFNTEKIAVMGHSFGAPFGLLAAHKYPEDYSIYIGIGQPVDPVECDRLSFAHLIEVATKEGNAKAVKELEKINGYCGIRTIQKRIIAA